MLIRSYVVLCFIAGISIASGSWYDEEDWGLGYPEPTTFVCPSNQPITSIYSDFNHNTSQREWKFSCHWNGPTNLNITTSWSLHANEIQKDFSFSCNHFDGSHFIFGVDVLYDPQLADGRWRFGCGRFPPGHRLVNCTEISTSLSIGKLQEEFIYNATDNTTFVAGLASQYDIGLKDRMWGLAYCKVGIVQCEKPPQPEGVTVTYDSLEYGSVIKYRCQANYTYVPERNGICDNSGLWTVSPPDCQPCAQVPYCQNILCASFDLNATVCLECQNYTADGLELRRTSDFERCEADPVITNSLPETITFDTYDILTLNCNAIGYPKPKVVWLHNSTVVNQGNRVLVLSNGSLVILSTMPSDAGLYVCMATSEGHNLSISVTLNQRTFEPPIIVDWTNTLYFPLRHSAELHCMATGHPQPNIIWSKDGKDLQHGGRIKILSNGSLVTLHIKKVKGRDAGRYRCKAINKIDWISREALVHVYRKVNTRIPEDPDEKFAPIIEPWNLLISAFANSQAILTCNSFGNPKPNVKWSKVTPYGNRVITENDRISLYDNGSLVIKYVDFTDKGQYFCRASNELGDMEKHLLFMVKSSPSLPTTAAAPTIEETVTTTSLPEISTETLTVIPTNSSAPTTDVYPQTADSHALTLQIYWSLLCTLSAYTVLSLL